MKSALVIVAGLLIGALAVGALLAALVESGSGPVSPPSTPAPSTIPSSPASSSPPPSSGPSASAGVGPSGSPGPSGVPAAFHVGEPAPALSVPKVGGGTLDLAAYAGKPVWLSFTQTTWPEAVSEFSLMRSYQTRYTKDGLVVLAVDVREDEATVKAFATKRGAKFPIGLDADGTAEVAWDVGALPIHFFIDKDGIVRDAVLGGAGTNAFADALTKILGRTVTP